MAEIVKTWAYTVRHGFNRRKKVVALVKLTNTERFNGIADAFDYGIIKGDACVFYRRILDEVSFYRQLLEEIRSVLNTE